MRCNLIHKDEPYGRLKAEVDFTWILQKKTQILIFLVGILLLVRWTPTAQAYGAATEKVSFEDLTPAPVSAKAKQCQDEFPELRRLLESNQKPNLVHFRDLLSSSKADSETARLGHLRSCLRTYMVEADPALSTKEPMRGNSFTLFRFIFRQEKGNNRDSSQLGTPASP